MLQRVSRTAAETASAASISSPRRESLASVAETTTPAPNSPFVCLACHLSGPTRRANPRSPWDVVAATFRSPWRCGAAPERASGELRSPWRPEGRRYEAAGRAVQVELTSDGIIYAGCRYLPGHLAGSSGWRRTWCTGEAGEVCINGKRGSHTHRQLAQAFGDTVVDRRLRGA